MKLVVRVYIPPYHTSFYPRNDCFIVGVGVGLFVDVAALVIVVGIVYVLGFSFGSPGHGQALSFVVFFLSWIVHEIALPQFAPP